MALTLHNSDLGGKRATTESLLLLIKKPFYPAMPFPQASVDTKGRIGAGDIDHESGGVIVKHPRYLEMTQMVGTEEVTGYRAVLSMQKFRDGDESYPATETPFLYLPYYMYGYTCYAWFDLIPNDKIKKQLAKKKQVQADELENYSKASKQLDAAVGNAPADMVNAMADMNEMEEAITMDKSPWIEGTYHVVVEENDLDTLNQGVKDIQKEYASKEIVVRWTSGDQKDLLLEQIPGDMMRQTTFKQLTNINMITTSGFGISSDVGDPMAEVFTGDETGLWVH